VSAGFWVSLSTIVFLIIVAVKSYKLIMVYFAKQQDEIKKKLIDADEMYKKADNLFKQYQGRMEALDIEIERILKDAQNESQNIINSTEHAVEKIISKKNKELSQRISEYELQIKNRILSQYADIIVDDLYSKVS
jgi:F0F1-type ATP synthase membrane subunit b/b'